MSTWHKYFDLEPVKRLKNEGRELLGQIVMLTEKRDGENVSIWQDEDKKFRISSHNLIDADSDIISRFQKTLEYQKAVTLLTDEQLYNNNYILYGELLKETSPTRIEPRRKRTQWILFDIYDLTENRYLGYTQIYQKAYHYKIPIVRIVDRFIPKSMEELQEKTDNSLKWCKKHRREGVVGKDYANQTFFKEKIDVPKLPKIKQPKSTEIQYPPMPQETILRALQHAFDEVGEEKWKDKSITMPTVAKHLNIEAREHNYAPPRNMYQIYLNTPIETLKPN